MYNIQTFRPAIAMIELIFALVIMGITLMSAPMLISQATRSSFVAFQQESIAITASHANALLTYAWDERNTESKVSYVYTILKVSNNADNELNATSRVTPGSRVFQASDPNATATPALALGLDNPEVEDDVDDFIDSNQTLLLTASPSGGIDEGDYIDQNISLATDVQYMDDNASYGAATGVVVFNTPKTLQNFTTNIKYLSVTLTSNSLSSDLNSTQIQLNAFMCNIGAVQPVSSRDKIFTNAPLGLF